MCFFNNIIEQEERPLFPWKELKKEEKYVGRFIYLFHVHL